MKDFKNMPNLSCPYCENTIKLSRDTLSQYTIPLIEPHTIGRIRINYPDYIKITIIQCPCCGNHVIYAHGIGDELKEIHCVLKPLSLAKEYPDYIPKQILQDYYEAYAIVNLSPKASATLSRRCLQGMIHDFWNIKQKNLNQEITALKDKVALELWRAIDSIRQMGNIGAHMEKDVNIIIDIEPHEAKKLLKLIELLLEEWYIKRHTYNKIISEVIDISENKQERRG